MNKNKVPRFLEVDLDCIWKNDKERIKIQSKRFKESGLSITEAFQKVYGKDIISSSVDLDKANKVQGEVKVGDIVNVLVKQGSNGKCFVDSQNYKCQFGTRDKLEMSPGIIYETQGKVTDCTNGTYYVSFGKHNAYEKLAMISRDTNIQNHLQKDRAIMVHVNKLIKGGYIGTATIPTDLTDFKMECFIPGGHIDLNHIKDHESMVGKNLKCFVQSFNPGSDKVALICSRKSYIEHEANKFLIGLYNDWCDNGKEWKKFQKVEFDGLITGVINTSKKCGVFVEVEIVDGVRVTYLIPTPADKLTGYHKWTKVKVRPTDFVNETEWDPNVEQYKTRTPYTVKDNLITEFNTKLAFKFV